ncbi:AAA family ATPase [Anabaena sp. UHCC 0253]|uniref:AAA family ATPase n=1 Tax=Anabaena sp. UHCC 0253 TaxID=2590019 RepID=UPI001447DE97|nr:AAA family ATPase [Anabaena sp. UHCC 0253]MTJ55790.1 AAA family ATPase [Anabaena sp. UHCC 0253]
MITEINLGNIRIFAGDEWNFSILPMTVFCGTNSAGKSTIIKSLLLLKQSQSANENYGNFNGKLRLVGDLVDLGNYSSFVSHNQINEDISIGFTIKDKMPYEYYTLISPKKEENKKYENKDGVEYSLKVKFIFGVHNSQNKFKQNSQLEENDTDSISDPSQVLLKKSHYEITVDEEILLVWDVEIDDNNESDKPEYEIIIPSEFFKAVGGLNKLIPKNPADNLLRLSTYHPNIFPYNIIAQEKPKESQNESQEEKSKWLIAGLPPLIREALQDLRNTLSNIHYIAPLRSSPQRYYLTYLESASSKEHTGENLPYILREKSIYNSKVWNVNYCDNSEPKEEILSKALNYWLYYLRVGEEPPQDIKKF